MSALKVSTRNARFQQWESLLLNRTKRQRNGEFLVQGVRPITLAVEQGWTVRAWLYPSGRKLSRWAGDLLDGVAAQRVEMDPELLRELGDKVEQAPELIAVVALPAEDLGDVVVASDFLGVVFDRPTSPGNVGTLVRSADAFGAHCVIVSGHAADVYDPKAVRASTGSLFALPVVRAESAAAVLGWVRAQDVAVQVVGTDEHGTVRVDRHDLTGPTLLVVGNETAGMSAAWREACDTVVSIPIGGAASSLNAATAGSVVLYEAARQRG
ncbi:TrmH family RNA methyltransferase [Kutzneria viridogrisea]|uniref:TrmH family RNA methyltransferase n=1 Tax=Kutzneria viridogrisea TaxID=47990 RepID=A0ABR6BCZ3_9PSEU|nr:TrmH family RNA methyltransferase [Kutzneria viridogrisea]